MKPNSGDERMAEISRFHSGSVEDFLREPQRRGSFRSARLSCVSAASDLPAPFKGDREGCEYYLLAPKQGRYAGLFVVLEIEGKYESSMSVLKGEVDRKSPFRRALLTGVGAAKLLIRRLAVFDARPNH